MGGTAASDRALRFLAQPSLFLLLGLVGLIVVYPFLETSKTGRAGLNALNIGALAGKRRD
jgi:hypothetical protein